MTTFLAPGAPLTVAVIAFDGMTPFHLSVPCLVFGEQFDEPGLPRFSVRVCAADALPLRTPAGFNITPEFGLEGLHGADIVIMPAWRDDCSAAPGARDAA